MATGAGLTEGRRSSKAWSSWTDDSEAADGKWWDTPSGQCWGVTLEEAVTKAVERGQLILDEGLLRWMTGQRADDQTPSAAGGRGAKGDDHVVAEGDPLGGEVKSVDGGSDLAKGKRTGKDMIPEYDGLTPMREYRRRVQLFESVTSISPEYRGGRLLKKLSGQAWKAAETLEIQALRNPDGVAILLAHLDNELEPLEYMKTFDVLSQFSKGEQMVSFDTSFRIQCDKMKEVGSKSQHLR